MKLFKEGKLHLDEMVDELAKHLKQHLWTAA